MDEDRQTDLCEDVIISSSKDNSCLFWRIGAYYKTTSHCVHGCLPICGCSELFL